ncbi:MAG: class I SAM-dependent methyltransferase [Desulfurellaceae bacterium]|nr:class I SAM-dependent methyltransferase [Desulfurellaceae bacterium]
MVAPYFEPGSFRDRTSRVFYQDGAVLRGLNAHAAQEWEVLKTKPFFQQSMAEGKIVRTEQVESTDSSPNAEHWSVILKHQAIPFISYPYEWPFSMLQAAALLTLELQTAALNVDMTLKDATPFNVQWSGSQPVFIDIPSFERLRPGEPWVGYRQFCQLFLYPLFLQAYKDIPFQPWLRGSLEGIEPAQCAQLMSLRDMFRPGVLSHVILQAKAQASYARTERNLKKDLRQAGFHKTLIQANVGRLRKLVAQLTWKQSQSTWSGYTEALPYTESEQHQKADFVRRITHSRRWNIVWDLGCNTGTFSRIAAENADYVLAMDIDTLVIERFYRELTRDRSPNILPLIGNVADPAPNLGWRGLERKALVERGRPDLTLCLALLHHVVISAHIPLREFITWLASLGTALVIEFVTRDDPMVRTLLRHKADHYTDYDLEYFERCLAEMFTIDQRETLESGTRILYSARSKRQV